ncbi:chemotaxis protein CheR [bacterium]|nr:MAG: chemotaxis protein CheR [bacterium]
MKNQAKDKNGAPMTEVISKETLEELGVAISAAMGLNFTEDRLDDLSRGLSSAAGALGFDDVGKFIEWLKATELAKKHVEELSRHLAVGETYFFRDKSVFKALEENILPAIINSKATSEKRLRVWSAACSTGEEAYSIAILLSRIIPDIASWNVTVLATDINANSLKSAEIGIYGDWSFRNTPEWIKESYFTKTTGGKFAISGRIKKMVRFGYLNLATDAYPSITNNTNAMDIIFCRNVLMYFAPDTTKTVMARLNKSLVDDGYLLVSPAEAPGLVSGIFTPRNFGECTFYQKRAPDKIIELVKDKPVLELNRAEKPAIEATALLTAARRKRPGGASKRPNASKKIAAGRNAFKVAVLLFEKGLYSECVNALTAQAQKGQAIQANEAALLARAYANKGLLDAAQKWSARAARGDKLNPVYHYLNAAILEETGRTDEAVAALKRVIYIDNGFTLAHFSLGRLMHKRGNATAARRHFRNALNLLKRLSPDDIVPESEGMTAGRLSEIISAETV